MREWILQGNGFYILAAIGIFGILSRFIVQRCLRHITAQTERGNNSRNRILQQIKGRFENVYRMNQGMGRMEAFVQKQIYLLRFCGIRLTTWRVISDVLLLSGGLLTVAGCAYCVQNEGEMQAVRYLWFGIMTAAVQILCRLWADLEQRERELLVNLEDYLGNTYAVHLRRGMRRDENSRAEGEKTGETDTLKQQKADAAVLGDRELGAQQAAAAREESRMEPSAEKKAGHGKRILTAEESKLIEEILQEYLN